MPIIHRKSLADLYPRFKDLVPYAGQIANTDRSKLLIAACGFEDRASAICAECEPGAFENGILISYPTNQKENERSLTNLSKLSRNDPRLIPYGPGLQPVLLQVLRELCDFERLQIVVDISAMASYVIYPVLDAAFSCNPPGRHIVSVFYSEALNYDPAKEKWADFRASVGSEMTRDRVSTTYANSGGFESTGVSQVYISELFPGKTDESAATRIIMIPSFSLERAQQVVAFLETQFSTAEDDFVWMIGNPPDKALNGWRHAAMEELYTPVHGGNTRSLCTRQYWEALRLLHDEWNESSYSKRLIVYANGSKMQHLAIYLLLKMHPDVGLALSEPEEFDAKVFSTGIGRKWWLCMGSPRRVINDLRSVGDLRFLWDSVE